MGLFFRSKDELPEEEFEAFVDAYQAYFLGSRDAKDDLTPVGHGWLAIPKERKPQVEKGRIVFCLQDDAAVFPDNGKWTGAVSADLTAAMPASYRPERPEDAEFAITAAHDVSSIGIGGGKSNKRFTYLFLVHRPTMTLSRTQSIAEAVLPRSPEESEVASPEAAYEVYQDVQKTNSVFRTFFRAAK